LRSLDDLTFTDLLRRQGLSEGAIHLRRAAAGGWDDTVDGYGDSALRRLRTLSLESPNAAYYKIRGGNDRLPRTMALRLADRIRYGSPVVRIERPPDARARVFWAERGTLHSEPADHVVIAIPFTLLRRIEVVPGFSEEKARAVRTLVYGSATKVFLQTRTRFWSRDALSGFAYTDLLGSMQVWELGHTSPGPRGLLMAYLKLEGADALDQLPEERRVATALDAVSHVHPDLPAQFEGGFSKSWSDDPWSRGAFALLQPGHALSLEPHTWRPEGRIHFAGEHTSPWLGGWMHSALESGERAAREINQAR
jgi:monoamine oxidase